MNNFVTPLLKSVVVFVRLSKKVCETGAVMRQFLWKESRESHKLNAFFLDTIFKSMFIRGFLMTLTLA